VPEQEKGVLPSTFNILNNKFPWLSLPQAQGTTRNVEQDEEFSRFVLWILHEVFMIDNPFQLQSRLIIDN
jgi:hypothetical protein